MTPLYVVYLRPQHDEILRELADLGVRAFATFFRTYPPEIMAHLEKLGAEVIALENVCTEEEKRAMLAEGTARAERVLALMATAPITVDDREAFGLSQAEIADVVGANLGQRLYESTLLVGAFELTAQRYDVSAVVVSEDYSRYPRNILQAARARKIPSYHVAHGAHLGRSYGLFRQSFADFMLVAGVRAAETEAQSGTAPGRIVALGAPQWDPYVAIAGQREKIRAEVRTKCGLAADEPIVLFATTTFESSTPLTDELGKEKTLRGFLAGAKAAQAGGTHFTAIIKDRMYSGKAGRELVDALSAEYGVHALYVEGRPEYLVAAADLVVGSDSNMSIEALLCGVPTLNIWSQNVWINGPYFGRHDGIPHARYDDPQAVGDQIAHLLTDEAYRAAVLANGAAILPSVVLGADGGAARRCATFIVQNAAAASRGMGVAPSGAQGNWHVVDADASALDMLVPPAPARLLALVENTERERLRARFPSADLTLSTATDAQGLDAHDGSFDLVFMGDSLAKMWDPWEFLVRARAKLRPGGRVMAALPNVRNIVLMHGIVDGDMQYGADGADIEHLRFFTRADAIKMFEQTGYALENFFFVRDARCADLNLPSTGTCNVETEKIIVKETTPLTRAELTADHFVVVARSL